MDNYTAQERFYEERAYYLNQKDISKQAKLELLDELEKNCEHFRKFPNYKRKVDCLDCMAEIRKELEGK